MIAPLRVGLDVRAALRGHCGIGRYAVELASALAEVDGDDDAAVELLLYGASRHGVRWAAPLPRELLARRNVRLFAPRLPAKVVRWLAHVPGFRTELFTGRLDLFHQTDLVYVHGMHCPEVVTVHDLAFEVSRDFHDPGFHRDVRERMQAAIARARAVIVPSAATRTDLVERWHVAPERITVIPLGGDHVLRVADGARPASQRPYLLHVGTLEPRKNVARLVRAYRAARARGLEQELVLVGPWGWRTEELQHELALCDTHAPVTVRGAVDETELVAWMRGATALCYPSLYEGFGLPVVEAFALGVPVVTSARSSTQEVAGDAALLVDPESEAELTTALLRIGSETALRETLSRLGRARAAQLTWAAAAAATLALYRRVAPARDRPRSRAELRFPR